MEIKITQTFIIVCVFLILGYMAIILSVITEPSPTSLRATVESAYQSRIESMQNTLKETEQRLNNLLNEKSKDDKPEKTPKISAPIALVVNKSPERTANRPGVIVLGMHRSGTSVLGGLINKMGLKTGGPLIPAAEDNEKGFFERIDVVLQNDALLSSQELHYAYNTYKYNPKQGLKLSLEQADGKFFAEGRRGLKFLNAPESVPWMLKDPRLCITFRTWLPLLNAIPAILFTYRHPLDVGLSMNKRETEHFMVGKGVRMWYVYNKMAIRQSNDLCRVVTSHRKVMKQPQIELEKIFNGMVACGVDVPHKLEPSDISDFIDVKLQHGKTTLQDDSCSHDLSSILPPSTWPTSDPMHIKLYREAMRVYCGLEDGTAFHSSFPWDDSIIDN